MVLIPHQDQVPLHQLAQVYTVVHLHLVQLIQLHLTLVTHIIHVQVHVMVRHLVADIVVVHLVVVIQDLHLAHVAVTLAEELVDFLVAPEVDLQADSPVVQDLVEMVVAEALVEEIEEEDAHLLVDVLISQDLSTKLLLGKK